MDEARLSREEIRALYESRGLRPSVYEKTIPGLAFHSFRVPVLFELIESTVAKLSPKTALDVGSGEGVFTAKLESLGVSVTSLDLSVNYLVNYVRGRGCHSDPSCLFVTPAYISIATLGYKLPVMGIIRSFFKLMNNLSTRFPGVFGNWIALTATRQNIESQG